MKHYFNTYKISSKIVKIYLVCSIMGGIATFSSCNGTAPENKSVAGMRSFGEQITADGAISMASLTEKMQQTTSEQQAKVEGNVAAVCQVKGCWMNLYQPDSSTMRVTFKDYAFFMPKDIEGKKVIVEGIAKYDTTSVEDLRHFAEDEGKSAEEIAAISAPAVELVFEANGVLLEP